MIKQFSIYYMQRRKNMAQYLCFYNLSLYLAINNGANKYFIKSFLHTIYKSSYRKCYLSRERISQFYPDCVFDSRGILLWSQDQIKSVGTHTHKKMVLKIFNFFFINLFLIIKKIFFYVCVTKHFLFDHVTILEFLMIHRIIC